MVEYSSSLLDRTFAALANPTRRAMVRRLSRGEATVGELGAPFAMSIQAVSKHLIVLERAGLVQRARDGRLRRVSLKQESLAPARDWIDGVRQQWERRFDQLAAFLDAEAEGERE